MKQVFISKIALTVFAMMIMQSCNRSSSKLDKFMGTWKRINETDDNLTIKRADSAILLIQKIDTVVARYDKKTNTLRFWVLSNEFITYNPKNDHLLFNNGKNGEAKRVK